MASKRAMQLGSGTRVVAFGLFLACLLYIAYVVRTALLLIFVSIIFAIIFSPWVRWIQRWRVRSWSPGRGAAILILSAIVLAGITLFSAFAVQPIANSAQQMTKDLPQNLESLQQKVRQLPFGHTIAPRLDENRIRQWVQKGVQQVFKFFRSIVGGLMALLTLILLTAYFILDGDRAFIWAISMVSGTERARLKGTLERSSERMQRWLYGQLILMLILGSSSAVVFGFLGVRYFYVLAVFAGLANFVPILGPIATVVVAGTVAALDSWTKVVGVIIFYAVYQQVENAYLTPRIMRAEVDLPGVAVIVALTIGGELGGLLGAIVAVPTAALVATVLDEYLMHDSSSSFERAA
jgi:predicted PurR-regulated permease PerM